MGSRLLQGSGDVHKALRALRTGCSVKSLWATHVQSQRAAFLNLMETAARVGGILCADTYFIGAMQYAGLMTPTSPLR